MPKIITDPLSHGHDQGRRRRRRKCYKESCLMIGSCCGRLGKYYRKLGCRHITPLLLLVVYTLVGAAVLHSIESPYENERERERISQWDALRNDTSVKLAAVLSDEIMSDETKIMQTRDWVRWYEKQLGLNHQQTMRWDIWGALFYVGTIYTTIGYGNISPSTTAGRLLTVVYAIFGIPLVLAILNDLGQLFRLAINRAWTYLIKFRQQRRRYHHPASSKSPGEETDDGQESSPIPISVALSLTLGWVLFCSGLFCLWESNWTYGTSLYFFFISLSTIGLGDVVPEKPHYMIANFGFVIIGLCLVSMTLGVIQQRIEEFLYRMMKLIRQEYENATDAQGRSILSNPSRLIENAWRKQAWHVRLFAPHLLSYKSQGRLDRCAVRLVRGQTFQSISRDLMLFKNDHLIDVDDLKNSRSFPSCCQKYRNPTVSRLQYPDSANALRSPQRLLCDISTQTDRERAFFDLLLLENEQEFASWKKSIKSERHDFIVSKRPTVRNAAVQACIRVQTVDTAAGDSADSSKKKRSKSASATGKENRKNGEEANVQTTIIYERGVEFSEKIVQTDDSYLRLASKLEALRTNRADSLAIMVTPGARKPSLTNEQPEIGKQQTPVKV